LESGQRVERAGRRQALDDALVDCARIHAGACEMANDVNRPFSISCVDDQVDRLPADALQAGGA